MKKLKELFPILIGIFFILFSAQGLAQIGINTEEPNNDADLELGSPDKALLLNRVSDISTIAPVNGMILYDETDDCVKIYQANEWHCIITGTVPNPDPDPDPDAPHTFPENITKIYLTTETGNDPDSKSIYLTGTISIDGAGGYEDFDNLSMRIRGRGNSSWKRFPKKGFRIKLDNKEGLYGMASAKDWVIIPDYLDGAMLDFSIPYEMGRMLGMPFTPEFTPVEMYMNGDYRGIYGFTAHKEVKSGRIDLEEDGVLLELDFHYDEPENQFRSVPYNLPVMIKYPKDENLTAEKFTEIETEFNTLAALIEADTFPENGYRDMLDVEQFVNYIMVMALTLNHEINNPGSVYMHKLNNNEGTKYRMGILWDFDWAYGFVFSSDLPKVHYEAAFANRPLFSTQNTSDGSTGYYFFKRIMEDPVMRYAFKTRWSWFKENKMEMLKDFVIEYARIVEQSYEEDHARWYNEPYHTTFGGISGLRGSTGVMSEDIDRVLNWLDARSAYIDTWTAGWD